MTAGDVVTGGCLCGRVRFTVTGSLRDVIVCHCSLCRRAGTGPAAYTGAARDALRLDREETLTWFVDANGRSRGFCRDCGSSLFWQAAEATEISVSAGAVDPAATLRVLRHIFVADRGTWEPFPTDAPAHGAGSASPVVTPE